MDRTLGKELSFKKLTAMGIKGERSSVITNHFPSNAKPGQTITVRFPQLGSDDVVAPNSTKLLFDIHLTSNDPNRTVVNNLGRNIVRQFRVLLDNNEVVCINDYNILYSYIDHWDTLATQRSNIQQGMIANGALTENGIKHRVGSADKATNAEDAAIGEIYGKTFSFPLDHALLRQPFSPKALNSQLTFEITFNNAENVVKGVAPTGKTLQQTYEIKNLSLCYRVIRSNELANHTHSKLRNAAILDRRIVRSVFQEFNNVQTSLNFNFTTPAKSLKGILFIFKNDNDVDKFVNIKPNNVTVTINGNPGKLAPKGFKQWQLFDEALGFFGDNDNTARTKPAQFFTDKFSLVIDTRGTTDNDLHGSGLTLDSGLDTISVELQKSAGTGTIKSYIYLVMDCQINIKDGTFSNFLY